jgi:hypothetical protein
MRIEGGEIQVKATLGQTVIKVVAPDEYVGDTTVTPSDEAQVLSTKDKLVRDNITVNPVPTETLATSENGTFLPSSGNVGFSEVVVDVEPSLESLSVMENGLYLPESGTDGFDRVSVDVPIPPFTTEEKTVTENGVYLPSAGKDGISKVTVNVPSQAPVLDSLSVTDNGTYVPSAGIDGFDEVVVNVPTGGEIEWDDTIYPVTDESDQYYADHVFNAVYIPNLYAGDTVIIEALGRGVLFSFRGGQPTSGYMQEYKIGSRTDGNILVRFTLNITADTRNFIIGGYQWSGNGSHSGYDYNCAYGEYIKYKVIHAS